MFRLFMRLVLVLSHILVMHGTFRMQTVADAAQQTTKVIDEAKPIATSTVQTISSAEPAVILATGGALVIAYLLLPPVLSVISFNLRGYQGNLPIL